MSSDAQSSLVGTKLGNYEIRELIGKGGMGEVYLAVHPKLNRKMAVKVLSEEVGYRKDLVERFEFEAQAVNRIHHDSIVQVTDFGVLEDGRSYYLMEHLDGESLKERLERSGRLSQTEGAAILRPVLEALQAAHEAGIVHRDLKPDNIYLVRAGEETRPKVLDFGIAKLVDKPEVGGMAATKTGMLMGTPIYMSPEQAKGAIRDIGPWSDVYSLGVVLFHMLAGSPPFVAETFGELLVHHMQTPPPPLSQRGVNVSPALGAVVERALAKKPEERFQSAREMRDALDAAVAEPTMDDTLAATAAAPLPKDGALDATVASSAPEPGIGQTSVSSYASEKVTLPEQPAKAQRRPRRWLWVAVGTIALVTIGVGYFRTRSGWRHSRSGFSPKKYGVTLSRTDSATRVRGSVEVVVAPEGIYFEGRRVARVLGGRVNADVKRDGPDGFFIDPLFTRAKELRKKRERDLKRSSRSRVRPSQNRGYRAATQVNTLKVAMDERTPYRLLAEVLYTLGQAGFKTYQLVGQRPDGKLGAIHISMGHLRKLTLAVGEVERLADGASQTDARAGAKAVSDEMRRWPLKPGYYWRSKLTGKLHSGRKGKSRPGSTERAPYRCILADSFTRHEVRVLVEVGAKGSALHYASLGSSWELDHCCFRPWIARWRLPPEAKGRYQLRFGVRSGITGLKAGPSISALKPVVVDELGCKPPLNLAARLSNAGVSLETSQGPECTPPEKGKKVCYRGDAMEQLRTRLFALWSRKYANARWWRNDPFIRGAITVIAEPGVRAQKLYELLDAAREKPGPEETDSSAPCRFVYDRKKQVWVLDDKGQKRCMYPFLTLALGS